MKSRVYVGGTKSNPKVSISLVSGILEMTSFCLKKLGVVKDVRQIIARLVWNNIHNSYLLVRCTECRHFQTDFSLTTKLYSCPYQKEEGFSTGYFCTSNCQQLFIESKKDRLLRYECCRACKRLVSAFDAFNYNLNNFSSFEREHLICNKCANDSFLEHGMELLDISAAFCGAKEDIPFEDLEKAGYSKVTYVSPWTAGKRGGLRVFFNAVESNPQKKFVCRGERRNGRKELVMFLWEKDTSPAAEPSNKKLKA